jgi:hypothetical protein
MSINDDIFNRYLYFNNLTNYDLRYSSAVQKMPDGAVYFNEANKEKLDFDLKVND